MAIPPTPQSASTPRSLKIILGAMICLSIAAFFLPLQAYLGLSLYNLSHGYVWTLLTYPFTSSSHRDLLSLGFNLFFLWALGSSLIDRIQSSSRFLILFFGATLFAGLFAALGLSLLHNKTLFASFSPVLLALLVSWTILHATRAVHLSALLVLRPFWIFAFFAGFHFLFDLLEKRWIEMIAGTAGALFGYLFCLLSERTRSTLNFLFPFEKTILRALEKVHIHKEPAHVKIYDIGTGEPVLDDEQFMDAMLARITLQGENSLSPAEKQRMQKISQDKTGKKS